MYRSIFLCVFLAVSASAYSVYEHNASVDQRTQKCINDSGIDQNIFDPTREHILTESELLDPRTGCYEACIWTRTGMYKEDGTLDAELMIAQSPDHVADPKGLAQAYTECAKQRGANVCETVSKTLLCLHHNEAFRSMRPKGIEIKI